ncbi:inositol monophosphatase family protein [Borreliella burgdorferi]|uniref:inositol monophosphatase family protein n=1 Tax=Borreliella burgdorferi TaxID=139 RepID=UPI003AB3B15F|nr:inositol monophosphatase [Borreliella burgdorferi]WKC97294.1 inositol monophosphatase [Borreliella burgdorferi]
MDWDFEKIIFLLNESTRLALSGCAKLILDFKSDGSIVTQVDKQIEQFLFKEIKKPGNFVLGEETISTYKEEYIKDALISESTFIIDPIDGTSSFAAGLPSYGISLAYASGGKIIEGAISLPLSGEFFITSKDNVFYAKKNIGSYPLKKDFNKFIFDNSKCYNIHSLLAVSRSIIRLFNLDISSHIHINSSCVYSFAKLFTGSYKAYFSFVGLWDIAACLAIGNKLGMVGEFYCGNKMTLDILDSMYILEPNNHKRWSLKDFFIYSDNKSTIDIIRKDANKKINK